MNSDSVTEPTTVWADIVTGPIAMRADSVTGPIAMKADSVTGPIAVRADSVTGPVAVRADSVTGPIAVNSGSVTGPIAVNSDSVTYLNFSLDDGVKDQVLDFSSGRSCLAVQVHSLIVSGWHFHPTIPTAARLHRQLIPAQNDTCYLNSITQ